jgi:hypothetical protein
MDAIMNLINAYISHHNSIPDIEKGILNNYTEEDYINDFFPGYIQNNYTEEDYINDFFPGYIQNNYTEEDYINDFFPGYIQNNYTEVFPSPAPAYLEIIVE